MLRFHSRGNPTDSWHRRVQGKKDLIAGVNQLPSDTIIETVTVPLFGHVDAITTSGFVEGWALDRGRGFQPLTVSVFTSESVEVARGLANLYRKDLAASGWGSGWNFFRLKLNVQPLTLRRSKLYLIDVASCREINRSVDIDFVADSVRGISDLDRLSECDPLVLQDIQELADCDAIFASYIRRYGVIKFVKVAYLYVLGRPADQSGLSVYGKQIRRGTMTPFSLLQELSASDEFRSASRTLVAPTAPHFAFSAP